MAVAVRFTHDLTNDVRKYVTENAAIGNILHVRLS
jgi:hypothetical protein